MVDESQTLDFAEDHGELLPLLDGMLGEKARESTQLARSESEAAPEPVPEAAPASQVPQPAPQPQLQPQQPVNLMGQPQVPGGMAPAGEFNPQASAPQQALVQPEQAPAPQFDSSTMPLDQYAQKQGDADVAETRAVGDLQQKAEREKAENEKRALDEAQPFLDEQAKIDSDVVTATDAVNSYLANAAQRREAENAAELEQLQKIANENPQDFWGNASTVQKFRAIIGMIGTGMQGKSASGYMDNVINQDIAAYNRRARGFNAVSEQRRRNYEDELAIGKNAQERIEIQKISRMQRVLAMAEAQKNKSGSPIVQQRLDAGIAAIEMKIAESTQKLHNQQMAHIATAEQQKIQLQLLGYRREQAARGPKPKNDTSVYFKDLITPEGGPQGLDARVAGPVAKIYRTVDLALKDIQRIEEGMVRFNNGEISAVQAEQEIGPYVAKVYSAGRQISESGAALSPGEEALIERLTPGWSKFVGSKLKGTDFLRDIKTIKRMYAIDAEGALLQNAPKDSTLSPDSLAGRIRAEDVAEQQAAEGQAEQVRTAIEGKSPLLQRRILQALKAKGNKVAASKLAEMDGETGEKKGGLTLRSILGGRE